MISKQAYSPFFFHDESWNQKISVKLHAKIFVLRLDVATDRVAIT